MANASNLIICYAPPFKLSIFVDELNAFEKTLILDFTSCLVLLERQLIDEEPSISQLEKEIRQAGFSDVLRGEEGGNCSDYIRFEAGLPRHEQ
ncbi:CMF_collapsed_G0013290.mRNA.1.CDS.1 [Saccharomyces cerevisiae]|nr:CMF_collapsed_G0013290.mRNA.1.CDS.1 [Saccharomyces cerevisiae]